MTREEEKQEAIKDIHKSIDCNGLACWQCIKLSIGEGISWADEHPRKGLWDAQKVIKYINEALPNYVELNCVFDEIQVNYNKFKNNFIHDLKKAMED